MGKTLHIVPGEFGWPSIVQHWIGDGPDRADHELLPYPANTSLHYLPESLSDAEMMRATLSFEHEPSIPLPNLYGEFMHFATTIKRCKTYDKIIVWTDEYAESQLLLCLIANNCSKGFYTINITPADRLHTFIPAPEETEDNIEVPLYSYREVNSNTISRRSFNPSALTREQRRICREEWLHWGGEDAGDSPILINQYGKFFHVHRTYLYKAIFYATDKNESKTVEDICHSVHMLHPQIEAFYIFQTLVKMAGEGMLKHTKNDNKDYKKDEFQQYKYDVEGEWIRWDRDFVYQFIGLDIVPIEKLLV